MNWKIVCCSLAAAAVSCAAANSNLFLPGDFEEWAPYPRNDADKMTITGGLAPKNWKCSGSKTVLSRDENVKYSGQSSVKLVFSPGSASELLYQPFPVKPGTKYRISFRIKGENLSFTSRTQAPWGGLQASPSAEKPWIDKKGELIFTRKSGTFDWTLFQKEFTTRPTDRGGMIRFNLPDGSGTLWLDDFRIEEAGTVPNAGKRAASSAEYSFRTSLNRENAIFRSGETVVCTFALLSKGKPATGPEFDVEVFRGPERIRRETVRSSGRAYSVSVPVTAPGQLLFRATVKDPGTGRQVQSLTGALIDPEKLKTNIPEPADFAKMDPEQLEKLIHSCGYYRAKAKNIIAASRAIVERFHSKIPNTMEELTSLPGVGRKTANVVLADAFGVPGLPVDTHVKRIMNLAGIAGTEDPEKIEARLSANLDPEKWGEFSHLVIQHGRSRCPAGRPDCVHCEIRTLCARGLKRPGGKP